MPASIEANHRVSLGIVPTHLKFVGGLVPDESGCLPRHESGDLGVVKSMRSMVEHSAAPIKCVQVPYFPGLNESDTSEMVDAFRELGLDVHFILMVGGADPMNEADEDQVVEMLVAGLKAAIKMNISDVSSTSVEEWMKQGASKKEGDDFKSAVAQNVKLHLRAAREANVANSCVKAWHIEFLRQGEFQTFTDIGKIWEFVSAANEAYGSPFFKVLVDAAHCGDSTISIAEHKSLIDNIAKADALGIFHASAKTTRGCLSTDDGWIGALLAACAETGKLETAFIEVFHHEDDALQGLRDLDPRHGIDTTDGRSYEQTVLDGVADVARRLNNLKTRGLLG